MEEYKIIEGFDNYEISNFGNIRNRKTNKMLKLSNDKDGYKIITLTNNNVKTITKKVHRLVALMFIPNVHNKPFVDHIDNNRSNNTVNNLRWVTSSENHMNESLSPKNKSGAKGVVYDKARNKWKVQIRKDNKLYNLGRFDNIDEAIKVRQQKAKELFGEFANHCEGINII